MANRFDLVIFDWDGTLFDSVAQIVASLQWAAAQHDIELCAEAAKNIIGLGLPEAMQVLFPQHVALQSKIQASYSEHYVANSYSQHWFAGVENLLDELAGRNMLLAVATGKSRVGLDRVLAQTNSAHRFTATRCASETLSKPHPMMLKQLLDCTGVMLSRAVMVGDTSYDLEMAQAIEMQRIGVSYGVHDATKLSQYQPLAIASSIEQLTQELLAI